MTDSEFEGKIRLTAEGLGESLKALEDLSGLATPAKPKRKPERINGVPRATVRWRNLKTDIEYFADRFEVEQEESLRLTKLVESIREAIGSESQDSLLKNIKQLQATTIQMIMDKTDLEDQCRDNLKGYNTLAKLLNQTLSGLGRNGTMWNLPKIATEIRDELDSTKVEVSNLTLVVSEKSRRIADLSLELETLRARNLELEKLSIQVRNENAQARREAWSWQMKWDALVSRIPRWMKKGLV